MGGRQSVSRGEQSIVILPKGRNLGSFWPWVFLDNDRPTVQDRGHRVQVSGRPRDVQAS